MGNKEYLLSQSPDIGASYGVVRTAYGMCYGFQIKPVGCRGAVLPLWTTLSVVIAQGKRHWQIARREAKRNEQDTSDRALGCRRRGYGRLDRGGRLGWLED